METKQSLPNSTAVLVMGILSIICSCFFVGLILGIIGLNMAKKGRQMHRENPDLYTGYGSLNAGWIMSIIGTILGSLYTLYYIIIVLFIGSVGFNAFRMLNM
jgi:hypothetical protein